MLENHFDLRLGFDIDLEIIVSPVSSMTFLNILADHEQRRRTRCKSTVLEILAQASYGSAIIQK